MQLHVQGMDHHGSAQRDHRGEHHRLIDIIASDDGDEPTHAPDKIRQLADLKEMQEQTRTASIASATIPAYFEVPQTWRDCMPRLLDRRWIWQFSPSRDHKCRSASAAFERSRPSALR
jgi:hypothetical protein